MKDGEMGSMGLSANGMASTDSLNRNVENRGYWMMSRKTKMTIQLWQLEL